MNIRDPGFRTWEVGTAPYESEPSTSTPASTPFLSIGLIEGGKGDLRLHLQHHHRCPLPSLCHRTLATLSNPLLTIMAPTMALSGRAPALLRNVRRPAAHSIRAFTAAQSNAASRLPVRARQSLQKRSFLTTARCLATAASQSAPDPKAYLQSGVVKPKESVDVKKVLVIGSGGLAIGQAGEFDYSGSFYILTLPHSWEL